MKQDSIIVLVRIPVKPCDLGHDLVKTDTSKFDLSDLTVLLLMNLVGSNLSNKLNDHIGRRFEPYTGTNFWGRRCLLFTLEPLLILKCWTTGNKRLDAGISKDV